MSKPRPACKIIATLRLPVPVDTIAVVGKALVKEYGNDVIIWEEPQGMMTFGKPIVEQHEETDKPT